MNGIVGCNTSTSNSEITGRKSVEKPYLCRVFAKDALIDYIVGDENFIKFDIRINVTIHIQHLAR